MERRKPFWRDVRYVPYLYILPNMILFMVFMIIPLMISFYYGFTKWNGIAAPEFIGLQNYVTIFRDKVFLKSIWNTVSYTLLTVPLLMVLALTFAMMLNLRMPLRGIYRSAIYLPAVVSTVIVGVVFLWIFNDQFGMINYLLSLFGGAKIKWNNDPNYAMVMIVVGTLWQRTGYNMVIYLAALQGISPTFYEAAVVDGASGWQRFWYITLPMLKFTHIFVLITCVVHSFRSFDLIYTMTRGGPLNSTKTLVMYVYETAFSKNYYGRASAAGVVLFFMVFVLTLFRLRAEREEKKS